MTHMQIKTNNARVITLVKAFYKLPNVSRGRYLASIMIAYPELYSEIVENIYKEEYERAVGLA